MGLFRKKEERPERIEPSLDRYEKPKFKLNIGDHRNIRKPYNPETIQDFKPYKPAPGVVPEGELAMDSYGYGVENNAYFMNNAVADGVAFMGYPRLAEMGQRAEYRHIVSTLAEEATREWIEFRSKGEDDKKDRIDELEAEFERLRVREVFRHMSELDSMFGIGQLYIDTGLRWMSPDLETPLLVTPETIKKGSVRCLTPIEPIWTSPNQYNSENALSEDFYRPKRWWVMGSTVNSSRLLRFVSREVSQLLKPTYNFGGVPLIQLAKPYVDNWVRTRQSVSDLINGCSIVNLKTGLETIYMNSSIEGLVERIEQFQMLRDNRGVFLTDKENEELQILSANLSGLGELQNQALEQICVVAQMPLVKFAGIQPAGLNASSDGEIRVWYDRVAAYQESFFGPHLKRVMHIAMLNIWGEIDEDIEFRFVPLWQLDEAAHAAIQKTKADTFAVYCELGAASNDEVREALNVDEDTPFSGVDMSGPGYEPLGEEEDSDGIGSLKNFSNPAAHVDTDGV